MLPGVIIILIPLQGGPVRRRWMEIARRAWWRGGHSAKARRTWQRVSRGPGVATPPLLATHAVTSRRVVSRRTQVTRSYIRINRCLTSAWNYSLWLATYATSPRLCRYTTLNVSTVADSLYANERESIWTSAHWYSSLGLFIQPNRNAYCIRFCVPLY